MFFRYIGCWLIVLQFELPSVTYRLTMNNFRLTINFNLNSNGWPPWVEAYSLHPLELKFLVRRKVIQQNNTRYILSLQVYF